MIIPLASLAGWEHMLAVTRALTIAATIGTGLILAWLAHALYRDATFAAFAAVIYLTAADLFLYRGWLAYADPMFGLFVVAAIACLWIACMRQNVALLAAAVTALTCAFMTKALTAYVFYGIAAAVLFASHPRHRAFLLRWPSWLLHAAGAAAALTWLNLMPRNAGQGERMFTEILTKLVPGSLADYAVKLVTYPLDTAVRLAPALFIAGWFWWRGRTRAVPAEDTHARTALWIALLNFIPYWLAPQSASRYLMPLYPLAALVIARVLWPSWAQAERVLRGWIVGMIALKLTFVLVLFPYYQHTYRGENYATVARQIQERVGSHPVYSNNSTASGLSVTAHLDVLRLPASALTWPPAQWDSGFVLNYTADPALGQVAAQYRMGANDLFLLCRGAACKSR